MATVVRILGFILLVAVAGAARAEAVTVFAAASLADAFEEIGESYRDATGRTVRFSFAASSTLAKQIESGAPANLFMSADTQWMEWLARRGLLERGTETTLLANRLVLITPASGAVEIDLRHGFDLVAVLGRKGRLAIGDPAHVPAGRYARQALTHYGVWATAAKRLVSGDNVRVALALVARGEVPAGIVYATDAALVPQVRVAAVFPESSHSPIAYPMALVRGGDTPEARDFYRFLQSEEARRTYDKYGFGVHD